MTSGLMAPGLYLNTVLLILQVPTCTNDLQNPPGPYVGSAVQKHHEQCPLGGPNLKTIQSSSQAAGRAKTVKVMTRTYRVPKEHPERATDSNGGQECLPEEE